MWDSRTQRVVGGGSDRVQRWQHSALSYRDEVCVAALTMAVLTMALLTTAVPHQVLCGHVALPTTAVPYQVWLYGGVDSRSHRPCTFLHALHLSELPSGWVVAFDSHQHLYFTNPETGASQWDAPALHEHGSDGADLQTVCREVRIEAEPEAELETKGGGEGEPTDCRSAEAGQLWVDGPPALSGHAVCLLGGGTAEAAMLVFGGQRRGRGHAAEDPVTNLLWRATLPPRKPGANTRDPSRWRPVQARGPPPSPRFCHASERVSDAWLILFGWAKDERNRADVSEGRRQFNASGARPFLSDLHRLRLDTMVWEALTPAGAVPRGRCQAVAVTSPDEQMLLIFGGARHADPQPGQQYGDMVVDLSDLGLLHLPTLTWLPPAGLPSNSAQRGGTNALVRAPVGRCFIFGGMNSDAGNDMPNFLNSMTEVVGLGDVTVPPLRAPPRPHEDGKKSSLWVELTPEEMRAAMVLGYDASLWDNGTIPSTIERRSVRRPWSALSPQLRAAAMALGYRAREWDEDMDEEGGFGDEAH